MPHFLMIMMITANMSLHFGHFFVIFFLDIFLIIILSITNYKTNFYHHINHYFFIGFLTFFNLINLNYQLKNYLIIVLKNIIFI